MGDLIGGLIELIFELFFDLLFELAPWWVSLPIALLCISCFLCLFLRISCCEPSSSAYTLPAGDRTASDRTYGTYLPVGGEPFSAVGVEPAKTTADDLEMQAGGEGEGTGLKTGARRGGLQAA
eukprot:TRINITY_DN915_c0_g1_i2.p1 TRINITY_DN915_c0_g1~~TRINITY_DN915_c0_g1_i2.p1  ORF type:complete len:123 (-),score=25.80 TRINITY_DN915_c0_g1_i2:24-392(-)